MDVADSVCESQTPHHKTVALLLLGGLLFLRLPFRAGILYFTQSEWVTTSYQIGTYFLTAVLIWWERKRLKDFHIDFLALVLIVLLKPIQTLILAWSWWGLGEIALAFPHFLSFTFWGISIGLAIALWFSRADLPKFQKSSLGWFAAGIVAGVATAIVLGYPESFQVDKTQFIHRPEILAVLLPVVRGFFYQLGYAGVSEEPLFRGFLWGYLRQSKWKDVWIWLFQTGLFTLFHIYYLNQAPISFWIIVPVVALVLGALAWRSHSISTSIAAHGAMNALGPTVGLIFAYYFH